MKFKFRKIISLVLSVILLMSTFASTLIMASATVTVTDNNVYIVVPETIYMKASTTGSTETQYFVNNTFNSSNNTVTLDKVNNATLGKLYFKCPNATNVSVSAKINNVAIPSLSVNAVTDANGYWGKTDIMNFTLPEGQSVSANNTAFIEWTFTATIKDGTTDTFTAGTTLYSPYYTPVGVAMRVCSEYKSHTDLYSGIVSWVSGIHSYTEPSNYNWSTSGGLSVFGKVHPRSPKTGINLSSLLGDVYVQSGNRNSWDYVTDVPSQTDNPASFVWSEYNNRNWYSEDLKHSFISNISVDTSRINNFNQIPNFTIGFLIPDHNNCDKSAFYIVDYTNKQNTSPQDNAHYTRDTSTYPSSARWWNDTGDNAFVVNYKEPRSGTPSSITGSRMIYHGAWNKSIDTTNSKNYYLKTAFYQEANHNSSSKSTKYLQTILDIDVTVVNKGSLRDLIANCQKSGAQRSWYNCTESQWNNYLVHLKDAYRVLGNPYATAGNVTTAITNLQNSYNTVNNSMKTATSQALHFGVVKTLNMNGTVNGYKVNNALAANDDGAKTFKANQKVTIAKNTYTNYTYKGYVTTASDYDVGTAINFSNLNTGTSSSTIRGYNWLTSNNRNLSFYYLAPDANLTFNLNGGTYSAIASTTLTASVGSTFSVPTATPVKPGYTFTGWTYSGTGSFNGRVVTFGTSNTLTANYVINDSALTQDDIFIDYATNKTIDVLANDTILLNHYGRNNLTIVGIHQGETTSKNTADYLSSITVDRSIISVENNEIKYVPNPRNLIENEIIITVLIRGNDNMHFISKLIIKPASSVYYEDSSLAITYSSDWLTVSGSTQVVLNDLYDSVVTNGQVPGFSSAYDGENCLEYSMGSAHKTTVYKGQTAPTATFTFRGTGFDIISLMNNNTGVVVITIDEGTGAQKKFIIDTFANFKPVSDGQNLDFVLDPNGDPINYQVPIISIKDLTFGSHTVKLEPKYARAFDHDLSGEYDFYLDAIRIHNPLGEGSSTYQPGKKVYFTDYIKTLAINSGNTQNLNDALVITNGAVFKPENYSDYGPLNELYLKPNQTVTFTLSTNVTNPKVYLSGRGYCGNSSVSIRTTSTTGNAIAFNSKAELFKEITGLTWVNGSQQISITNTGGVSVSLCQIMVCGDDVPMAAPANVMLRAPSLASAMSLLSRPVTVDGDTQFYPETVNAPQPEAVEAGDSAEITVNTSKDVAKLTINGVEATKTENGDVFAWSAPFTAANAGTLTLEIVAYNAEGARSEATTVTVDVNEKTVIDTEVTTEPTAPTEPTEPDAPKEPEETLTKLQIFFEKLKHIFSVIINFIKNLF